MHYSQWGESTLIRFKWFMCVWSVRDEIEIEIEMTHEGVETLKWQEVWTIHSFFIFDLYHWAFLHLLSQKTYKSEVPAWGKEMNGAGKHLVSIFDHNLDFHHKLSNHCFGYALFVASLRRFLRCRTCSWEEEVHDVK